ncbi:melanocyte-stimulating hormone receptor-like [Oculina patagonica]
MAIPNLTEPEKHTEMFQKLLCSAGLTDGIHKHLTFILMLNIFLSITAFLGNALILVALRKESSLHPPSRHLLRCLATTDLCVGLISEPLAVAYWIFLLREDWSLCRLAIDTCLAVGFALGLASLFTIAAISVDRLLALSLGLRYRQVVALKRTYAILGVFWVVSIAGATLYLINHLITFWFGYVVILICSVTSVASYTKIFCTLCRHQTQVKVHVKKDQPSQAIPLNIMRHRKAVLSTIWVQMALVVCYLPYGIVTAVLSYSPITSSMFLAWEITATFVYFNSTINPFLYCWKISEVKQAVKQTIRDALCCLSS